MSRSSSGKGAGWAAEGSRKSHFLAAGVTAATIALVAGTILSGGLSDRQGANSSAPVSINGVTLAANMSTCVTSSAFCIQGSVSGLAPGTSQSLLLTLMNPNSSEIYVTGLTVTAGTAGACDGAANLSVPGWSATGQRNTAGIPSDAIIVPAGSPSSPGLASKTLTITWRDLPTAKQDSCLGQSSIPLTEQGTALVHAQAATKAVFGSSLNPSTYGQSVTFTDTVSSVNSSYGTPTGSVTFSDGSTTLATVTLSGGKATYTTSGLAYGGHTITASYAGTPDFAPVSASLSQTVNANQTVSGSQSGGLTVPSGQVAVISSSGKVTGAVTVQSGGILYLNGGTISGGLMVQSGGSFNMSGGTVSGGSNITGAKSVSMCGATTLSGGVTVTGATGTVVIGNPSSCAANSISGGLTVSGNTGGVTFNGNTVTGGATINSNTGPTGAPLQTMSANNISGGLTCSGNANLIDKPTPNTVNGPRSGQCAGSF